MAQHPQTSHGSHKSSRKKGVGQSKSFSDKLAAMKKQEDDEPDFKKKFALRMKRITFERSTFTPADVRR